ncbi:MAG: hypothetical protein ACXWQQ_13200 [Pseudobdellovibrio sp.]
MFKVILFLSVMSGSWTYADQPLSSLMENVDQRYAEAEKTVLTCSKGEPSQNKTQGCVESFKYISGLCSVLKEDNFSKKYKKSQRKHVYEACDLYAKIENSKWAQFIELDSKSCVSGYESIPDRIASVQKNKDFFDENFFSDYEKHSCKEFRTYVNLCVYIDGDLKDTLPKDYTKLPKIDYQKGSVACKSSDSNAGGLNAVNSDIASLSGSPESKNVYEKLILDYRARKPASQGASVGPCNEVRNGYANLGCARFETVSDEDPIYYNEDDFRKLRIQKKQAGERNGGNN